jgi:hypothetical protein
MQDAMNEPGLRPIERRMQKLTAAGADDLEIAWRFRRTPRTIRNMRAWAALPRQGATPSADGALRPIERCVLRWLDDGVAVEELSPRFRRGPAYLEQVEQFARKKRGY